MKAGALLDLRRALRDGKRLGPADPEAPKRRVEASALRAVLRSEASSSDRLWLRSIHVEGMVDLAFCRIGMQVHFENCTFDGVVNMTHATVPELTLLNCDFEELLWAPQLEVERNLILSGSRFRNSIDLGRATVGGPLAMVGSRVESRGSRVAAQRPALILNEAEISGGAMLQRLESVGEITMIGCRIGGPLLLWSATLTADEGHGTTLKADRLQVGGSANCNQIRCDGEVRFAGASFGSQLTLLDAHLQAKRADGTWGNALIANGLSVTSDFFCLRLRSSGAIRMNGASVGGQFSIVEGSLEAGGDHGIALDADRMKVGGSLAFGRLKTWGEIRMLGAQIGGQFGMRDGQLDVGEASRSQDAVSLDGIRVGDGMFMDRTAVHGELRLMGATIDGMLSLSKTRLRPAGPAVRSLGAESCQIEGSVQAFEIESKGEISFTGCRVSGQFDMSESTLEVRGTKPSVMTLGLERSNIEGGLYLEDSRSFGEIRLTGARIGVQLSFGGARLEYRREDGPDACTVNADGMEVGGSVACANLHSIGEFRMVGAVVNGQVSFDGARCEGRGPDDDALSLDKVEVKADLLCRSLRVSGEFRLLHAVIGGRLELVDATLEATKGPNAVFAESVSIARGMQANRLRCYGNVEMSGARVGFQLAFVGIVIDPRESGRALDLGTADVDELLLAPISVMGNVDLRNATVRTYWDAAEGRFVGRRPQHLLLNGFHYDLREPLDASQRLTWICDSPSSPYLPDVYSELADAFRRLGRAAEARKVLIAGERHARRQFRRFEPRGLWQDLLGGTIGYGYRNWLAGIWLVALTLLGALAFKLEEASFSPKDSPHPDFSPLLYSIESTVPILDLGQRSAWIAGGVAVWVAFFLSICGYALATAVIAAATGLLNRDHSR